MIKEAQGELYYSVLGGRWFPAEAQGGSVVAILETGRPVSSQELKRIEDEPRENAGEE